jgi:hypothetical protein
LDLNADEGIGPRGNNVYGHLIKKTKNMKKTYSLIIFSTTILGVVIFSAVCWHSIGEIHYLKSFFPKQFSVQEAYYATAIELIKVIIIGLPIALILSVGLYLWGHRNKDQYG